MTDDDFQTIAVQIDELEGALRQWDYRRYDAARLTWLHDTITTLTWASQALGDQDEDKRTKYAALEHRSRQCREIILRRKQELRIVTIVVLVIAGIISFALFAVWLFITVFSWIDVHWGHDQAPGQHLANRGIAVSFGIVYMLYGWRIFRILVVICFGLFGMYLGIKLDAKTGSE